MFYLPCLEETSRIAVIAVAQFEIRAATFFLPSPENVSWTAGIATIPLNIEIVTSHLLAVLGLVVDPPSAPFNLGIYTSPLLSPEAVSRAASFAADPLDLDTVMSPLLSLKGASRAAATAALLSLRVGTSPQLGSEETSRASDAATFPLDRKTDTTSLLNPRVMSQVVDITVVLSGLATVALLLLSRAANAVVALRHLEPVPSTLPSFKELSQAAVPAAVLLDLEAVTSPLLIFIAPSHPHEG